MDDESSMLDDLNIPPSASAFAIDCKEVFLDENQRSEVLVFHRAIAICEGLARQRPDRRAADLGYSLSVPSASPSTGNASRDSTPIRGWRKYSATLSCRPNLGPA